MLPALAIGVLLTGCGSSSRTRLSHDAYLSAISRIQGSPAAQDAEKRFVALAAGLVFVPKSDALFRRMSASECSSGSKVFVHDVHRIIDDVARLQPPEDAEDLQRRFLAASRRTAGMLDRLSTDVTSGRVTCGHDWNQRAYGLDSTMEAEQVLSEFADRYHLASGEH
jgi:hypothetical protein